MVLKLLQKIILSQKKNYSPSSSSAWSAPWRRVLTLPLVILPVVWAHARPSLTFWNRGREAQRGGAASVARAHKRQSLSSFRSQLGDTRPDLFSKWTNQGAIKSIVDWCFMQRMDHDDPQLFLQLRWGSEFCNRIKFFWLGTIANTQIEQTNYQNERNSVQIPKCSLQLEQGTD